MGLNLKQSNTRLCAQLVWYWAVLVRHMHGQVHIWRSAYLYYLQAITLLTHMLNPPDEAWGFLDLWNHDEAVVKSVGQQIACLSQYVQTVSGHGAV